MHVTVIGGGAIGLLITSLLKEDGHSVTLIAKRETQVTAINAKGVVKDGAAYKVAAASNWNCIPSDSPVFIAVKYDSLDPVLEQIYKLPVDQPLIFLQNGLLHLSKAAKLPQKNIAVGSIEHGAVKISDYEVRHTGKGLIKFAAVKGDGSCFLPFISGGSFASEWHEDADKLLFRKVLLNCLINPLTAVLMLKNGELLTNPYARQLQRELYEELAHAFPEMGTMLPLAAVEALCRSTAANTSSMLADRQAGKRMELDTIILSVLNRTEHELPRLQLLYYLLKSTEV